MFEEEDKKINVSSVHGDATLTVNFNITVDSNKVLDEVLTLLENAQEVGDVIDDIRALKISHTLTNDK